MKSKRMRILDESGKSLLYADKDKLEMNVKVAEFIGMSILNLLKFTKTLINQITDGWKIHLFLCSELYQWKDIKNSSQSSKPYIFASAVAKNTVQGRLDYDEICVTFSLIQYTISIL